MLVIFGTDQPEGGATADRLHLPSDTQISFPGNYVAVSRFVCEIVREGDGLLVGVLLCTTGAGMAICANKHKGIYAVACYDEQQARDAREINNANVLCLSARNPRNADIVQAFLTTQYQGRKPERMSAIRQLEADE